ncbi:CDP-alcohol phosphatidyltransferase family protein [Thermodesulfobacteriota bacterium]
MNFSELRNKCKRDSDYIITLFITNEISLLLTWILVKTRVTPNQVTVASIIGGLFCGLCYAFGWFLIGSIFLFFSHILDCTDGNLARAKEMFSPFGKWLDMVGDRVCEVFIFIGVSFYFVNIESQIVWVILPVVDALILAVYYYIVDISLALGLSKPKQTLTSMKFKGVHVKWGIMEPVIYGFIILVPLGLLKVQVILVLLLCLSGLAYQFFKSYPWKKMRI